MYCMNTLEGHYRNKICFRMGDKKKILNLNLLKEKGDIFCENYISIFIKTIDSN